MVDFIVELAKPGERKVTPQELMTGASAADDARCPGGMMPQRHGTRTTPRAMPGNRGLRRTQWPIITSTYMNNYLVPMVVGSRPTAASDAYDIYSAPPEGERIIFLVGPVHDAVASLICAQLLFLQIGRPRPKDIAFYITSPGGVVTSGMAIYDTMQYIRSPVSTVCIGQAASMGSLLLCAGTHGKRFSLPNSGGIMIHQPSGGTQGQATDIEESRRARSCGCGRGSTKSLYVGKHTGQPLRGDLAAAVERDKFLSPLRGQGVRPRIDEVVENATRPVTKSRAFTRLRSPHCALKRTNGASI